MTVEEIELFLDHPRVGVLATIGRDGYPHLSGMWFVPAGDVLRMWTYAKSQKTVNARRDERASLLIEDGRAYNELKGISFRGRLAILDAFDDVRSIGVALYERYTKPDLDPSLEEVALAEIDRQAQKRVGLELHVTDSASWDHSKLS